MPRRSRKILIAISSGALASALLFAVLFTASAATERGLVVTFFDVGQGDGALIRTPQHQNIVIDGGPDGGIMGKLGASLPFYDRTIDLMILTHPHADHVVGLIELLDRYEVREILINGLEHDTSEYRAFIEAVFEHRIPLAVAREGEAFQFGDDCILAIHAVRQNNVHRHSKRTPSDEDLNDSSIVATLTYNSHVFLLMGDAGEPVERDLLAAGYQTDVDVLKVGHHGSKGASSLPFLKTVRPEVAIISSGAHNSYGHPHRQALQRLKKSGAEVYRTDERGDIRITSIGSELSVHTSR
ncbi:MAG: ComEC/Rec2 family competence protein [Patescibacteria group bacterium]